MLEQTEILQACSAAFMMTATDCFEVWTFVVAVSEKFSKEEN